MLSNEEADYLLGLEKSLLHPTQTIDLRDKKNRVELFAHEDLHHKFWVEITSNQKVILKTSIHHLESNSFVGLLRIDFRGGHKNPVEVSSSVPEKLRKYAGLWFTPNEPHLHVYVEGYRPLAWAFPLKDTDFPIKHISSSSDLVDLITNFARKINLTSKLNIQGAIF